MSPRLVCALEKFGECSKSFYPTRAWQKCCSGQHTNRLRYLKERKVRERVRRRMASKRIWGASNARSEHSKRNPAPLEILKALGRKAVRLAGGPKKVLVLVSTTERRA